MPEIEEEIIGSQSEESEEKIGSSDDNTDDVMSMFGIEKEEEDEEKSVNDKTSAIEDVKADKPEPKLMKVKHNKEEIDVDISTDEKLTDHLQRSLALDKERERKTELERNLDRAAKLAGYTDHAAYVADLDKLEQQQQQSKIDELETLRKDMLDQLEENGVDRTKAEQWINSHPLIKQGEEAIEAIQKVSNQAEADKRWQPLYEAHPELIEDSQAFKRGEIPTFFTPELQALVARGNDPLLAYQHLNRDKIQQQTKKATEQRVIKEQQLGLRSRVETNAAANNETAVPDELANAFAAFGLPVESAKKYMKK